MNKTIQLTNAKLSTISDHLSKHEMRHEKRAQKEKKKQQQQIIAPQLSARKTAFAGY